MGARRGRLVRQFLAENVLMAVAGAGVGLLLGVWGVHILRAALRFNEWVETLEFSIDTRVLIFNLGLSIFTVLVFGLTPALHISRSDLHGDLKEGGRSGGAGASRVRARRVFVVAEVALALVLLTGAGLMIKSFQEEMGVYPGFNKEGLLTAELSLPLTQYGEPAQQAAFSQQVTEKIQHLPGVVSAAVAVSLPLTAEAGPVPFSIEGQPTLPPLERPQATYYAIGEGYLPTLGIPLISGRAFTGLDNPGTAPVVLVNEAFARRFFPRESALGQHIRLHREDGTSSPWCEVVGVVGNVKDWFGQPGFHPQVYVPYVQAPSGGMTLVVRTKGEPTALASAVRAAVWSVDKDQPLGAITTLSKIVEARGQAGDRLMGELLGFFAGLALILAAVGIYGIIAHGVAQRTHEMGIRLALGAGKWGVLRLVVGDGMKLAAVGLLIGFALAYPLPSLFKAAFEGFTVNATWVYALAPVMVGAAAFLASYVPARRATKVDPLVALRYE
jgi:putative ABC transport system permease protein